MSESLIAYLLYGVLKALEYLHRMGYVHRSVGDVRRNICRRNICITSVARVTNKGEI